MAMTRWNPVNEMVTLHDAIDRLLAESFVRPTGGALAQMESSMPIDMYEENDKLIVKTSMPGVMPENVDINVQDDVLTITGEVKSEENKPSESGQTKPQGQTKTSTQGNGGQQNWYMREHQYARFVRSVTLPFSVQADKAEATMEHGMLTLQLPKAEQAKQKKIQVKAK